MIEKEIVQRFINRFAGSVDYNVNVMNRDGVIIAARDSHRIGVYHAVAHEIVRKRKSIVIAQHGDELPTGVLPGVNVSVCHGEEIIGVVGVTGDYREVESVAYALKTSLETVVEYEAEKERLSRRQDRKRELAGYLLYKEAVSASELSGAFARLGYDYSATRVAIVFQTSIPDEQMLSAIKGSALHTRQDISLSARDDAIVVFRALDLSSATDLTTIEDQVRDYCSAAVKPLQERDRLGVRCYCGSVQSDPGQYWRSYEHARWLIGNETRRADLPAFFFDRCLTYALNQLPSDTIQTSLHPFSDLFRDPELTVYLNTFRALSESNLSMKGAAHRLGVHRNTVVLRLQRLREITGLDPMNHSRDRRILDLLVETSPRLAGQSAGAGKRTIGSV